jgi:hypothetical protein
MSSSQIGGIFTIITNTGFQDKIIMAMENLNNRLRNEMIANYNNNYKLYPGLSEKEFFDKKDLWFPPTSSIETSHILFVNSTFKPFVSIAHEYSKTMPRGSKASLGQTFNFTMPVIGQFVSDSVMHIRLEGLSAIHADNKVRYIEMLGHRVMKKISFKLNEIEFDSYNADRYNIHWQYKVSQNKETGYLQSIGQEIPKLGYLTADPTVDSIREYRYFGNGAQTFKRTQSTVDMWIPLLFWFKDIHNALPNSLFPYGQTNIEVQLEQESNLVGYANYASSTPPFYISPVVTACDLYMNHIYLDPTIYLIFITNLNKSGYQLIRINRTHTQRLTNAEDSILLNQIKWPVECMYVAFRPIDNLNYSDRWHRNTAISVNLYPSAVVTGGTSLEINSAQFYNEVPVIDTLGLRIQDIDIYKPMPPEFYNAYVPYQYGYHIKTPRDIGWFMMNFNLYPGDNQPSGHINSSLGREFYLNYTSAIDPNTSLPYIRTNNPVDLIVVTDCINFLMIQDNSAILHFST